MTNSIKNTDIHFDYLTVHTYKNNDFGDDSRCKHIFRVQRICYLGIFSDEHLKWHLHVNKYPVMKLRLTAHIFYSLRSVISNDCICNVYLEYALKLLKVQQDLSGKA